jgi:eukaryotic-like serine/threonine-protein kinase
MAAVLITGRYRLEALLGAGGMGEVHRAVDLKLGREVALKLLPAGAVHDQGARERIVREATAGASLRHPGIAHVYDVGETEDGGAFLVMELVVGTSLRALVADAGFTPRARAQAIVEMGRALGVAHRAGLVHRDVKPDNMMRRADGSFVLLDFGIAKVTVEGATTTLTNPGQIVGTPGYLSPEQARSEPMDARSDQFSLAVTAHELLSGDLPWRGATPVAVLSSILTDRPRSLACADAALAGAVGPVLSRALEKDPADRFPTIDAFADAFSVALGALPPAPDTVPLSAADLRGQSPAAETLPIASDPGDPALVKTEEATLPIAPRRRRGGRRLPWVLGGALLAALAAAASAARWKAKDPAPVAVEASATPADGGARPIEVITYESQPFTPSSNPEADRALRRAMRQVHHGEWWEAMRALEQALSSDPELVSAHFQAALIAQGLREALSPEARRHFAVAREHRDQLTDRERKLLDAMTPGVLDPSDWAEEARRLEGLVAASGTCDVPALNLLAAVYVKEAKYEQAIAPLSRSWACDPDYVSAAGLLGQVHALRSDLASARQVLEECLRRDPGAFPCQLQIAMILSLTGECREVDVHGRQYTALHPDQAFGYELRLDAATGLREAPAVLDALVGSIVERTSPEARARTAAESAAKLALYRGDLDEALRKLDELDALPGSVPEVEDAIALRRAAILVELGEARRAAEVCERRAHAAITQPRPEQIVGDRSPQLWVCARDGGLLGGADLAARREAWLADWKRRIAPEAWTQGGARDAWLMGFAKAVRSAADAREAIARAADLHALPPADNPLRSPPAIGEMYRLAGQPAQALLYLERGARACDFDAFDPSHDLHAGQAHEALGHTAEACGYYQRVLDRWAKAKPRSVTADAARAAMTRLPCRALPVP